MFHRCEVFEEGFEVGLPFRHDHRGRFGLVVPAIAPRITHIKHFLRGQQRLQKKIAVIQLAGAVPLAVIVAHQIEGKGRLFPGVFAVVHSQQAHCLERDAAHGHHRGEGDAAGEECRAGGVAAEPRPQQMAEEFECDCLIAASRSGVVGDLVKGAANAFHFQHFVFPRLEEVVQHPVQQFLPTINRRRAGHLVAALLQTLQNQREFADQLRFLRRDGFRRDAAPQAVAG